MGSTYFGFDCIINDFMMLDVNYDLCSNINSNYYLLLTSFINTNDDVNLWQTRLEHIVQERIRGLAKKGLTG